MYISQLCKTWLLTASCASLLLAGGALAHAQTADTIDYLYVSPQGNDSWSGQSPTEDAGRGPFQTLGHAQDAVSALTAPGLTQPVEVLFDPGVCSAQDFLSRWFTAAPSCPVIWHSDPSRTILIYTPTTAEQVDALSAEDSQSASGSSVTRFYVSPSGDDASTGQYPSADADKGPFQSLGRAEDAVNAFQADNPAAPVEVVVEDGFSGASRFLMAGARSAYQSGLHKAASGTVQKTHATFQAKALAASAKVTSQQGSVTAKTSQPAKLVFAHYMVANRNYGGSVAGYERDIQDAQAAGVDGFALNIGWWSGANYKKDTASMFQAAHALGTGFKLFFSADEGGNNLINSGMPASDVINMMEIYGNDLNYFHYLGRPVLSTWGGDGKSPAVARIFWLNGVLTPLHNAGYNVYFVPQFGSGSPQNTACVLSTSSQVQSSYQLWWQARINSLSVVDGLFEVSVGPPLKYAYSRTVSAGHLVSGQRGGLTLRDQHWECFYDPTHEFTDDDLGRTITITADANFKGGTYTITDVETNYHMTDMAGHPLGSHTMIVLSLPGGAPSPANHYDATGGSYTVQTPSSVPQKGNSLLAEEAFAQVAHTNGKLFISSVSPQYWTSLNAGRTYCEFCGGDGLAAQWDSVISVQKPEWVELFTWNDFGESTYFSPVDDVAKYWPYAFPGTNDNAVGYMKSHAGFTALNKYYINWYKSGVQPLIAGDNIYYFYRTQPMNMAATNDPRGPVTSQCGPVADMIYVTAMVSSAATLQVQSGSASQTFSLPAGTSTLRVPFSPGSQTFTLLRNGQTVLTQKGAPVVSSAPTYNFELYSGFLSNQSPK